MSTDSLVVGGAHLGYQILALHHRGMYAPTLPQSPSIRSG